jgi:hypothetical protein
MTDRHGTPRSPVSSQGVQQPRRRKLHGRLLSLDLLTEGLFPPKEVLMYVSTFIWAFSNPPEAVEV